MTFDRVLIVDDDPLILELVRTRLTLAGFRTRTAPSGRKAFAQIADFDPQALVLDINMPEMDGFAVLRWIREQGLEDRLPTLMLTARHEQADVAEAIRLGARDFLAKPFRDDQLIVRVRRLLAASARRERAAQQV